EWEGQDLGVEAGPGGLLQRRPERQRGGESGRQPAATAGRRTPSPGFAGYSPDCAGESYSIEEEVGGWGGGGYGQSVEQAEQPCVRREPLQQRGHRKQGLEVQAQGGGGEEGARGTAAG